MHNRIKDHIGYENNKDKVAISKRYLIGICIDNREVI